MTSFSCALGGLLVLASGLCHSALISSGSAEIRGTFQFDFESAVEGGLSPTADVWWEQMTSTTRQLAAASGNSAALIALGVVPFASISEVDLMGYAYSSAAIEGPPSGSLLNVGGVFAVRTTEGNFAKAIVTGYDTGIAGFGFYDIQIRYELYGNRSTVPEPGSWVLALGALLLLATTTRRSRSRS